MKRWFLSLFIVLVCLASSQAQVPATTDGSLATPGFTVSSFDGQYIYYNDNDGTTHRVAVTPQQTISAPVNPCNGTQTAINTVNQTFYYCSSGTWIALSGPGSPGTISGPTPSVSGTQQIVYTANAASTTVTNLNGGSDGQTLSIVCKDTNTAFQNQSVSSQADGSQLVTGNLITATGGLINCQNINAVFTFFYSAASNAWIQISSSFSTTSVPITTGQSSQGQFIATNQGQLTGTPAFTYNFNTDVPSLSTTLNLGSPTVATNFDLFQGPIPSIVPFAVGLSAPPQVQASGLKIFLPGFFGGGVWSLSPTSPYVQSFASGDINHSISRNTATSSYKETIICSLSYCQQGSYLLWVDVASSAVCGDPTSATVQFIVKFTDDVGQKTVTLPLFLNGSATIEGSMPLGDTTTWAHGMIKLYNGGANNISISSSMTPCNSGTAAYNWDAEVLQLQ